ncbi:MAG: hypothetical protein J6U68_03160 [Clostridia bacterium]|nr:hypothetical protein [Clostridia bacterium]
MINGIFEFTFRPVANKKPAVSVFIIIMAMSGALVIASAVAEKYKGVISLFAVILLCSAIYLLVRFIVCEYAYALVFDSEDIPNLIVTKTVGKRVTTLFSIPISRIIRIEAESAEQRRKHETPFGTKKYYYNVTMFPKETYRIYASGRGESCEIILEITPQVADKLMEYAALARTHENEEE